MCGVYMSKIPVIIDTDPGIDDALALLIAFQSKKIDIKLITTVAGNVDVNKTTENALYLVKKYGYDIPVVKGAPAPLKRSVVFANDVHGESGLGNFKTEKTNTLVSGSSAEDAIYAMLQASSEPMTVIALGPLTNIAHLVIKYPDACNKIDKLYTMIGSFSGEGNIVANAEFNAYADPEAVDVVLKSPLNIILSPMELGIDTCIPKKVFSEKEINSDKDVMIKEMIEGGFDSITKGSFGVHDPNTILAITKPCLYSFKKCDVEYSTDKDKYGQMFINLNENGRYTVQLIQDSSRARKYFLEQLYKI